MKVSAVFHIIIMDMKEGEKNKTKEFTLLFPAKRTHPSVPQRAVSYFIQMRLGSAALYYVSLFLSWFNELKWDETHSFPQDKTKPLQKRITDWSLNRKNKKKSPHASRLRFPAQVNDSSFVKLIRLCFCAEPWHYLFKKLKKSFTWIFSRHDFKVTFL